MKLTTLLNTTILTLAISTPVLAAPISWTDWQSAPTGMTALGQIDVGGTIIEVTASSTSNYAEVQTGAGTNFWTGPAYTNGTVDNAPTPAELIRLNAGGEVTVSFSQSVENIYVGLVSWNGNIVVYDSSVVIDSYGQGYWGTGTPILNGNGDGFTGSGEVHGVVLLPGAFDNFSFTHTSENWHGFTVGIADVAEPGSVPEPGLISLLLIGLSTLTATRLRRHR